jgi:cytochrome c oxidase assembly protein Cox11
MMAMTDERQRQQRAKNRALLAVLVGLVVLFYVMALVKMGAF